VTLVVRWIGAWLDALKPDIQCVRTHWIRGFIALQQARGTGIVELMVSA
jgi:hypothetical protein